MLPAKCGGPFLIEEVGFNRFLTCPSYETCLDYAADKSWKGFHCRECYRFQEHHGEILRAALRFLAQWLGARGLDVDEIEEELGRAFAMEASTQGVFTPALTGNPAYLVKDVTLDVDGLFEEVWKPEPPRLAM